MILDYIDNIQLSDDRVKAYYNELHSLGYLAQGLSFLYEQVQRLEAKVIEQIPSNQKVFLFGNAPALSSVPRSLVACAFHWYTVTVCNYVRMIGWLAAGGDSTKADDYVRRVLPAVHIWRNKVGAHFAKVKPKKEDTPADLALSVLFPISFGGDAFYAGSLILSLGKGGKSSTSRRDMRWSLTHAHRELIGRYWPSQDASPIH